MITSPIAKAVSIADLHFAEIKLEMLTLELKVNDYRKWLLKCHEMRLKSDDNKIPDDLLQSHDGFYGDLSDALQAAIAKAQEIMRTLL